MLASKISPHLCLHVKWPTIGTAVLYRYKLTKRLKDLQGYMTTEVALVMTPLLLRICTGMDT